MPGHDSHYNMNSQQQLPALDLTIMDGGGSHRARSLPGLLAMDEFQRTRPEYYELTAQSTRTLHSKLGPHHGSKNTLITNRLQQRTNTPEVGSQNADALKQHCFKRTLLGLNLLNRNWLNCSALSQPLLNSYLHSPDKSESAKKFDFSLLVFCFILK